MNTLIIEDADRLGLSQLHQRRGRIGRSARRAYAYLTYRTGKVLTEVAAKRLTAIREYVEFGSGFKIAMRDLEIRGAGNVLGKEQHGHITAIGFQLYCRLLDETIRRLKGEKVLEKNPVSLQLGFDLVIPPHYISDPSLRMEAYHKIFNADQPESFQQVTRELIDRFGALPDEAMLLLETAQLKVAARKAGITSIQLYKDRIYFRKGEHIKKIEPAPSGEHPVHLVVRLRNVLKQNMSYDSNLIKVPSKKRSA